MDHFALLTIKMHQPLLCSGVDASKLASSALRYAETLDGKEDRYYWKIIDLHGIDPYELKTSMVSSPRRFADVN